MGVSYLGPGELLRPFGQGAELEKLVGVCHLPDLDPSAAPLCFLGCKREGCGQQSWGELHLLCVSAGACVHVATKHPSGAKAWPAASGQKTRSARRCAVKIGGVTSFGHTVLATFLTTTLDPSETGQVGLWTGRFVYASIGPNGTLRAGSAP